MIGVHCDHGFPEKKSNKQLIQHYTYNSNRAKTLKPEDKHILIAEDAVVSNS